MRAALNERPKAAVEALAFTEAHQAPLNSMWLAWLHEVTPDAARLHLEFRANPHSGSQPGTTIMLQGCNIFIPINVSMYQRTHKTRETLKFQENK